MTDENSNLPAPHTGRLLNLAAIPRNLEALEAVSKALGSDKRLAILSFLGTHTCSVLEIAEALDLPFTTATQHINILERAGLIKTDLQPSTRGLKKVCARIYDQVIIQLPVDNTANQDSIEVSMPIGAYSEANVTPTCGLVGEMGIIGHLDQPTCFYEPDRIYAQLLWFRSGHVEYRFPNRLPPDATLESLELSFEVCSEAPLCREEWPSDITVWINGTEIGTWTSPGDFGGQRGALTPDWWDIENTQFGLMKIWKVTQTGCFIDGMRAADLKIRDLNLKPSQSIDVRIGVKETAHNVGGINLFGRRFGNYPQDLSLRLAYARG